MTLVSMRMNGDQLPIRDISDVSAIGGELFAPSPDASDIPESERQKFAGILLGLRESKDGEVLKILRATKFVKANDEEYANIRALARELNMQQ